MTTSLDKQQATMVSDEEKGGVAVPPEQDVQVAEMQDMEQGRWSRWAHKIISFQSVEARGIQPIPVEERTNRRTYDIFTLWFTMSTSPLP
jgi:hypothetical protein